MSRTARFGRAMRATLVFVLVGALATVAAGCGASRYSAAAAASPNVTVDASAPGAAVPRGFLGISIEYRGLESYLGANPAALDQPFVQLLRNLAPAGDFVLRIGGDSTDWTWWPVPHMALPGGVRFSLTPRWAAVASAVATQLYGRLILGLNFEADSSRLAAYEESQLLAHVGAGSIDAFELGNEPELYSAFPWYKRAGKRIPGRPRSYDVQQYVQDFHKVAAGLTKAPLAGPASGSNKWLAGLPAYLAQEPALSLVTVHAYPTKHCGKALVAPTALFATPALQGLADQIGAWVHEASLRHLPLRIDEMNSVSCGGQLGLSNSFAPALWALDMLPRLVAAGAAGVNFDTIPNSWQAMISANRTRFGWRVSVQPVYLGLAAFAEAAPAGSHLIHVASTLSGVDAWATRASSGQVHVVLINAASSAHSVRLAVDGAASGAQATVTRLQAPSLTATANATLGGVTISPSSGELAPHARAIPVSGGSYPVSLPAWSAAIVTLG